MITSKDTHNVMLITGTSKGIGRYLAEYYAKAGFNVVGCSRTGSDIKHENYHEVVADISIEEDVLKIFRFIRSHFKVLDIVINNAAINPAIISCALIPYTTIEKIYKVNVFAPMLICREAVKLMGRNKWGRIINIGSMASKHEVPGEALYTSTKAAMIAYSRVLAKETGKQNITVNVVAPSVIETELSSKIDKKALADVLSRNAIQEYGLFSDVTNTIDYLIDNSSKSITGQVIYLGGV